MWRHTMIFCFNFYHELHNCIDCSSKNLRCAVIYYLSSPLFSSSTSSRLSNLPRKFWVLEMEIAMPIYGSNTQTTKEAEELSLISYNICFICYLVYSRVLHTSAKHNRVGSTGRVVNLQLPRKEWFSCDSWETVQTRNILGLKQSRETNIAFSPSGKSSK